MSTPTSNEHLGPSGPQPGPPPQPVRQMSSQRGLLAALMLGNFVTGTGILLPAGMLTDLAEGLGISVSRAGYLMLASGFVVALGAPLLAAFTSRFDRQRLLVFSLILFAACLLASALAPDLTMLLALRVLMAVSAAIYTPQAAATVGVLFPPEQRAAAISAIFIGWSFSTVGGMPLGGFIAGTLGWRAAFAVTGIATAVAALAVWWTVPHGVRVAPLGLAAWMRVLKSPALMLVLLVTILNGTGQFTFFTYVTPSIEASLQAGTALMTALLAWHGLNATLGNIISARLLGRVRPAHAALAGLLSMALGLSLWGMAASVLPLVICAALLWGLGTFATNSIQQARLASLAPELASASIALNTSSIYLGQAMGSGLGGVLIDAGHLAILPLSGAAILFCAAAVSFLAQRYEGQHI